MRRELPPLALARIVTASLQEDLPWGDLTTESLFPTALWARREVVAKRPGVLAGVPVLEAVFQRLSPEVKVTVGCSEGAEVEPGQVVAVVEGDARALLAGERVALNFGLSDGVLVKDNHLSLLRREGVSLREALARIRSRVPHGVRIQVEVTDLEQVEEALEAGADALLLDNMDLVTLREAVARCRGRAITEASGGSPSRPCGPWRRPAWTSSP